MSNYSKRRTFNKAIQFAAEKQKNSQDDLVFCLDIAYKEVDPNARLASIFPYSRL
jgi:SecD/SecF fusion protein